MNQHSLLTSQSAATATKQHKHQNLKSKARAKQEHSFSKCTISHFSLANPRPGTFGSCLLLFLSLMQQVHKMYDK